MPRSACASRATSGSTASTCRRIWRHKDSEAWCGVQIIDLKSGSVVEWVRLDGPVTELFDVAFLDDVKCPMALGQQSPENLSLISIEGARV